MEQGDMRGLDGSEVGELRQVLHDLSSVFTGILVSGGLMNLALGGDKRQRYSTEICEGAERGAALVRRARAVLTAPEQRIENIAKPVSQPSAELDAPL